MRCWYCCRTDVGLTQAKLTNDDIERITSRLKEINLPAQVLGGEPLLHPRLEYIISRLNSKNVEYMIQTNFSYTDKIKDILKRHHFQMSVSIHRTQIKDINKTIANLIELRDYICNVDVMYSDIEDLRLAEKISKFCKDTKARFLERIGYKISPELFDKLKIAYNDYVKNVPETSPVYCRMPKEDINSFTPNPYYNKECPVTNYYAFDIDGKEYRCPYRHDKICREKTTCSYIGYGDLRS